MSFLLISSSHIMSSLLKSRAKLLFPWLANTGQVLTKCRHDNSCDMNYSRNCFSTHAEPRKIYEMLNYTFLFSLSISLITSHLISPQSMILDSPIPLFSYTLLSSPLLSLRFRSSNAAPPLLTPNLFRNLHLPRPLPPNRSFIPRSICCFFLRKR